MKPEKKPSGRGSDSTLQKASAWLSLCPLSFLTVLGTRSKVLRMESGLLGADPEDIAEGQAL